MVLSVHKNEATFSKFCSTAHASFPAISDVGKLKSPRSCPEDTSFERMGHSCGATGSSLFLSKGVVCLHPVTFQHVL